MGAYLACPITEKVSSDESNEKLTCGASSMQGWRKTQEDAHNSILSYDTDTALFAVYDGHGGKEVAEYTAQKLPDFIKSTDAYKNGDYNKALKDAFLAFDATLKEPEVVNILKEIAGNKETPSETEDENIGNLKEEAQMPIEEVMAKYTCIGTNPNIQMLKSEASKAAGPVSPFLRGKGSVNKGEECEVSSCKPECSTSRSKSCPESEGEVSSSSTVIPRTSLSEKYSNGEIEKASEPNSNDVEEPSNGIVESQAVERKESLDLPDSSGDCNKTDNNGDLGESWAKSPSKGPLVNGDVSHSEVKAEEAISSSVENGGGKDKGKGKGKALMKKQPKTPEKKNESPEQLFQNFVYAENAETSESDSDDVTFHGPDSTSDDEEGAVEGGDEAEEGVEEGGAEEEEDSEDLEEEEDDDEEDEDDQFTMTMTEEPGSDSGCTAVVALVKNNCLYVANAGDSRCVVSRGGEVIEMSLDHKPEDEVEMARIVRAGGKVTGDGRVNGGLNLSRALGDHVYKQVAELTLSEQMISPLPDVKELPLDSKLEFMVLACDGIWNFMSSREVLEFVRTRLLKEINISTICEELFDHCLAPDTLGDGTGCDNMTAVIVQFRDADTWTSKKRRADEGGEVVLEGEGRGEEQEAKRARTEGLEGVSSSEATPPDTTQ